MKKVFLTLALIAATAVSMIAQKPLSEAEQKELSRALGEAGNSPVDFIRALERHLQKFPNSPQKADFELAIAKAAVDAKDNKRIVEYGEKALARDMDNAQLLDRVARVLLNSEDKDSNERALKYSKHLEDMLVHIEKQGLPESQARMSDELDRSMARAITFEARATGNLGRSDEAIALASKAFDRYPTAEAAREIGRWLAKSGKPAEAIEYYADAFTISDPNVTDMDRARDRAKLGELYVKEKKSEAGLGDLVLTAYDRMAALFATRLAQQQLRDPNANRTSVMEFTLTGIDGKKLPLSSLKGKVVVMDFWATWCGPCRGQYPLYQEVKKRFAKNDDVIFLAINTDEDRSAVKPFLEEVKWNKDVYFEDGLQSLLKVASIPATIVINRDGQISSRMNGYFPDRFVDMLSERINDALGAKPAPKTAAALQQ